jgi:hypothetical protein
VPAAALASFTLKVTANVPTFVNVCDRVSVLGELALPFVEDPSPQSNV